MSKKGDMSMAVVIGAAIALLILVLLSVMLFNTFRNAQSGTSCYGVNDMALCVNEGESCSENNDGGLIYTAYAADCGADMKCCIPIGG